MKITTLGKTVAASMLLCGIVGGGSIAHAEDSVNVPNDNSKVEAPAKSPLLIAPKPAVPNAQPLPAVVNASQKESAPTPAPASQETTISYEVPCLTVRGDETHGQISYLPMSFTRTETDKPLRIMIADDTPDGSGQEIRSSVWLAAVTAAMLRNDTMHGVTISLEFSGNIDGPSAGGVTCLAILSALDGLDLPKDFAMTGTILPDGTIGVVGGVPEKMRAAAKSGVKRIFIPAFLRIFKNAKGEDVDLNRLADELKVELHRVENISEAYAILHRKPYQEGAYVNVRNMTKLPREVEDVLLPVYKDLFKQVSEKLKAQPKLERCYVTDDYVLSPNLAQDYYQEGRLLPATLQIFRSWQAWQAWEKTEAFLKEFYKEKNPDWNKIKYLREHHFRKLLFAFRGAVDKHGKELAEEGEKRNEEYIKTHYSGKKHDGYFPFVDGLTEITAQLEPVDLEPMLLGQLKVLAEMKRPSEERVNQSSLEELKNYWSTEVDLLRLLFLALANNNALSDFLGKLGKTLPPLHANKHATEVERLFYSAACASGSVAVQNFQSATKAFADGGRKTVESEVKRNPVISSMIEMHSHAESCHQMLQPDAEKTPTDLPYHLQASLKAQISSFTLASAMLVMYGADQSSDFTSHLLRNARGAAIRNINDCVKAGIPCLPAICDFELAEASRNSNKGIASTLVAYWRASLYSKALLMSFNQK